MSTNGNTTPPNDSATRNRRGSFTSQTFNNIFGRSNSTSGGPTAPFPGPITTAAAQDQRRRMSISTLGLSGTSPTQNTAFPFGARRGSVSTAGSDSIDENAIDDEEGPGRSQPTTPFTRRVSFGAQALRSVRGSGSPGTSGEGGFNWSEQLRSRAESSVSQSQRPSFSTSPTAKPMHERAKSITEMPAPPTAVPAPAPARPERKKPDAFQERILKGDFYMD
ncbi:uncharacterized protein LY89DRAFT_680899 [Mollisia scopiformis]|uniref:Uncharacterized protein n=1 Tax=Mollisia scopiformis TaxID=149040 RepID=A0A194XRX1_MOLSC|nr:uncharacterized protein LY89DRAFT_680899 [Mollisia scopiformis]KUJ22799.1 hypothetical protein LY89DRAFT_680899 [Mollisia scopiformis]